MFELDQAEQDGFARAVAEVDNILHMNPPEKVYGVLQEWLLRVTSSTPPPP